MYGSSDSASHFVPSRDSGRRARRGVYGRLSESLSHIFAEAAPIVAFDRKRAELLIARLGQNVRFPPRLFARYFDALAAIDTGEADAIEAALASLLTEEPASGAPARLRFFAGPDMSVEEAEMVRRNIPLDDLGGAGFEPVPESEAAAAGDRFAAALALLAEAAPATFAEIEETILEVILAKGANGAGGYTFDGVSSLQYWGAILCNVGSPKTLLGTCEAIAHEAGHNALFGFSPRTFFVWNRDEERYTSPLRDDPRPLDGIYHAAFVLARMHFAMAELLASGRLDAGQEQEAREMLARDAKAFADGAGILRQHARFTDEGRAILDAASAYMAAA